jgi:hypothetical protein
MENLSFFSQSGIASRATRSLSEESPGKNITGFQAEDLRNINSRPASSTIDEDLGGWLVCSTGVAGGRRGPHMAILRDSNYR